MGAANRATDTLSRRVHDTAAEMVAVTVCKPAWLEAITESYRQDATAQRLLTRLALDPNSDEGYSLQDGVLK